MSGVTNWKRLHVYRAHAVVTDGRTRIIDLPLDFPGGCGS